MASGPKFEQPRFIAVEGPLGVGKAALARRLADELRARLLPDVRENPFLTDFYKRKRGAGFQAQLYFLIERFGKMRELDLASDGRVSVVSDFLFEKDRIYANQNLSDAELRLYEVYFEFFAEQVPTADLVIYLQAKVRDLEERVAGKKDSFRISGQYLEEIVEAYEHFFFHYKGSNLLVIDTSEIDFIDRNEDLQKLLRRLRQPVRGTQYFLPLGSASAD